MLHYSLFETHVLKAFSSGVSGFLVGVWTDLHAVILVSLRRNDEGREFFLLQVRGKSHCIGFAAKCGDLQCVRANRNGGAGGSSVFASRGGGNSAWTGRAGGPSRFQIVISGRLAGIVEAPIRI